MIALQCILSWYRYDCLACVLKNDFRKKIVGSSRAKTFILAIWMDLLLAYVSSRSNVYKKSSQGFCLMSN